MGRKRLQRRKKRRTLVLLILAGHTMKKRSSRKRAVARMVTLVTLARMVTLVTLRVLEVKLLFLNIHPVKLASSPVPLKLRH
jgi:hypothetical protein